MMTLNQSIWAEGEPSLDGGDFKRLSALLEEVDLIFCSCWTYAGLRGGQTSLHGCPYLSMEGHARVYPPLGL